MKVKKRAPRAVRQLGYVGAILILGVMWWAVGHLSEWDWPSFLTDDIDGVVPWFRASLAVEIAFNAAFLFHDRRWFKAVGDAVSAAVNGVVAIVLLWVFPFDFSAYDSNWEPLTRVILIVAIVGAWVTAILGAVKAILLLASPPVEATQTQSGTEPAPKDPASSEPGVKGRGAPARRATPRPPR